MVQNKKEDLNIKEKLIEAKQKILELEEKFEGKIAEKPVQSIGIAFGVGFLSGALLLALIRKK